MVNELLPLFDAANTAVEKLRKILLNEDHQALAEFVRNDLSQNIEPVTMKIDALFHVQIAIVKEIREKEKDRYELSLNVGMASFAMSIILGFMIVIQWRRFRNLMDSI